MLKVDKKYCKECGKRTTHNYVGSKSDFEGLGFIRSIVTVSTLGISESVGRNKYWQCSKCGEIKKEI